MSDLFSELQRIKAQLTGSSAVPAELPERSLAKPVPGLPEVTQLRRPQSSALNSQGHPADG